MKPTARWSALLLAVLGTAISFGMLVQHHESGRSWVDICGKGGGCDQVLGSRWAYFPPSETGDSLPVALLGGCYFLSMAVWLLFLADRPGRTLRPMAWLALAGALGSIAFIGVMSWVVKALCPWCLATHLVNFALVGTVLGVRVRIDHSDSWSPRLVACAFSLVLSLGALAWMGNRTISLAAEKKALALDLDRLQQDSGVLELAFYGQEASEIELREDDPMIEAEPGYRNTLVVFGDAECSACRRFHRLLEEQIRPAYGSHLRVVFKHLPLQDAHPEAMRASLALEAAREQGQFWRMLGALYERQTDLAGLDYSALARDLGLDVERFEMGMDAPAAVSRVREDMALAERLGIEGTPAVYLNGRKVGGSIRNLPGFWESQAGRLREMRAEKGQGWNASSVAAH